MAEHSYIHPMLALGATPSTSERGSLILIFLFAGRLGRRDIREFLSDALTKKFKDEASFWA